MKSAKTQDIDWDDLKVFNAVVSTGSLSAASNRLGVNHSTVFRRLQRLESSVGARLFDRLPEGYVLTPVGEEFKIHAERIGDEVNALQLRLSGADFKPGGTIRLTAPDNIAYTYLPAYLEEFCRSYPDIRIELVVGGTSLDLTRREADLAVRATKKPPGHLIGRKICSLAWAFYASPDYLAAHDGPHRQSELKDHKLIGGEGATASLAAMRWLEKRHATQIVARCNTLNAMSALAVAGLGVALLPDDQQKPELERLFPVRPAEFSDLWVLTHPELRHTERIRLLVKHLVKSMREDPRLAEPAVSG